MTHHAGLDVSVEETAICVVDDGGRDREGVARRERAGAACDGLAGVEPAA